MIPDSDSFTQRFNRWLMEQPEAHDGQGAPVTELMNVISTLVHILRQNFKAVELPHLLSYIALRTENGIRENGGLWMSDGQGSNFRVQLAEEKDGQGSLIDMLYSMVPDDVSDLTDREEN